MILNKKIILLTLLAFLFSNCSSLLSRKDYFPALSKWKENDPKQTMEFYPGHTDFRFIKTLEKAQIDFFSGRNDFSDLERLSERSKSRLRFSATRELKSFFYLETEGEYYASEHEIIYMHILLGLFYARSHDIENAKVEARYAGNLLEGEWSKEGQFDEVNLRILLGALWTTCGEWEEAKVDFRAALKLAPRFYWLRKFAYNRNPPKELILVGGGPGAEPVSDPKGNLNLIRGLRNIGFEFKGTGNPANWQDNKGQNGYLYLSPKTKEWYERHLVRDNAIHELIQDSKYFERLLEVSAKNAATTGFGVGSGILIGSLVVAAGVGLAYLSIHAQISPSQLVPAGALIAVSGIKLGASMSKKAAKQGIKNFNQEIDPSPYYRYVRFLPEYLWLGRSEKELVDPVFLVENGERKISLLPAFGKIPVRVGYYSDMDSHSQ